jgi:DNA-binding CsgD family transcriptional regulator
MLLKRQSAPTVVVRNCCRCGTEFRIGGTERVCLVCRKPRQHKSELRNRRLTFREKQIVDLVSQAKLNKEIAYQLHLSEGTIKEYLNKIFRKLEVKNRTELAVWSLTHPSECRPILGTTESNYPDTPVTLQ